MRNTLASSPARLISQSRPAIRSQSVTIPLRIAQRRQASTAANLPSNRIRNFIYGSTLLVVASTGYVYITDTRASIHRYIIPPLARAIWPDAEDAHHATIKLLKELYALGANPRERGIPSGSSSSLVEIFGEPLANRIGISGGLDKNAEVPDALFALGPSIVEVGGVTPHPQGGNPRPRVFRIPGEQAIINRYGLNSDGAEVVAMRLRQRVREFAYAHGLGIDEEAEQYVLNGGANVPPGSLSKGRLLAVQIAKNKITPDDNLEAVVNDHVYCVEQLGKYADILVVNVSSPNTPGLRALQSKDPLTKILSATVKAAKSVPRKNKPAVMVKVSPDEDSKEQIRGICDAVWISGVDGVIVGNTTMLRPEPLLHGIGIPANEAVILREQGGFSGPHLFERTIHLIKTYKSILELGPPEGVKGEGLQQKVIFASGGITNGQQALEAVKAGASIAMVYTALTYGGVGTISRIKGEMESS
ncbi:orotate reductase [Microthyrium microscopicum]|uniref:Dihydroorotate dehydrogenase (quinone), mitochondrial n=1 Tax=Microthyrium microscopicum TaxID=703497 RepID=A0A6A6UI17_9PEZI|nr:orotate reductase [Microthyrium microscopicum]